MLIGWLADGDTSRLLVGVRSVFYGNQALLFQQSPTIRRLEAVNLGYGKAIRYCRRLKFSKICWYSLLVSNKALGSGNVKSSGKRKVNHS